MVSYVLLIVITISIAAGVYAWLKLISNTGSREFCPDDVALSINNYECDIGRQQIMLVLQNKGNFNIDGFFIKGGTSTDKIPATELERVGLPPEIASRITPGRFDFNIGGYGYESPLNLSEKKDVLFSYANANPLKKIELQPFVKSKKDSSISLCKTITKIDISC